MNITLMEHRQSQCLEPSSSSAAGEFEVVGLLTTSNREANQVAMHAVRNQSSAGRDSRYSALGYGFVIAVLEC
jgi:hypothetical protein